MQNPITPQKSPYKVKVEKDKTYSWCSCGESQKQPFCDGSHRREGSFKSVKYLANSEKRFSSIFSGQVSISSLYRRATFSASVNICEDS